MKAYRGRKGTAPLILHLGTRWSLVINLKLRPLYPREITLVPTDTHFIGLGLVPIYFKYKAKDATSASQGLVFMYFVKQVCGKMLLSELRHILYTTATCEKMTKIEFRSKCYIEPMLTETKLVPQLLVLIYDMKFYGNSIISEKERACGRGDCGY
jgi:hypothetical protein